MPVRSRGALAASVMTARKTYGEARGNLAFNSVRSLCAQRRIESILAGISQSGIFEAGLALRWY